MSPKKLRRPHRLRILLRYLAFLIWEFRWPLGVFWTLVLGGGAILHRFYHDEHGQFLSYGEACYGVFLAIFLESYLKFPQEWYLQPWFFLLPIVGLGAVADSLIRLAYLALARKQNLPEWQNMVASLYRDHVVVVGVGKVGFEIIQGLLALHEAVVAVERPNAESSLLTEVSDAKVPIIRGDGRSRIILERAGVASARAVVFATSDDLTNLDGGLTALDINPRTRIVLRLFDETLAGKIQGAFAIPAISTSRVAAPAFVAAATGRKVYQEFQLGGRHLSLTDLTIAPASPLIGRSIGDIQSDRQVNVVMRSSHQHVDVNPGPEAVLEEADIIILVAPKPRLLELEALNQPSKHPAEPILSVHGGKPPA